MMLKSSRKSRRNGRLLKATPCSVNAMCFVSAWQLLSKPKFSGVEKIKTIGSTYMAATGLNVTPGPECAQASHDVTQRGGMKSHTVFTAAYPSFKQQ